MTIKKESGESRQFSTGAHKQVAVGKGTPVLFPPDAYLDISKHFEDGAVLHGDRNWEKGIPLSELINSLERHIAQEKMGLIDEAHDRAIAWNAIVYLATKLRIKAGILPAALADIQSIYNNKVSPMIAACSDGNITLCVDSTNLPNKGKYYFVYEPNKRKYLWRDLELHQSCCSDRAKNAEGCYKSSTDAEKYIKEYFKKREDNDRI